MPYCCTWGNTRQCLSLKPLDSVHSTPSPRLLCACFPSPFNASICPSSEKAQENVACWHTLPDWPAQKARFLCSLSCLGMLCEIGCTLAYPLAVLWACWDLSGPPRGRCSVVSERDNLLIPNLSSLFVIFQNVSSQCHWKYSLKLCLKKKKPTNQKQNPYLQSIHISIEQDFILSLIETKLFQKLFPRTLSFPSRVLS